MIIDLLDEHKKWQTLTEAPLCYCPEHMTFQELDYLEFDEETLTGKLECVYCDSVFSIDCFSGRGNILKMYN